jgi:hypothetical protein
MMGLEQVHKCWIKSEANLHNKEKGQVMQVETKIMHGWNTHNKLSQNLPQPRHENIHQFFFV